MGVWQLTAVQLLFLSVLQVLAHILRNAIHELKILLNLIIQIINYKDTITSTRVLVIRFLFIFGSFYSQYENPESDTYKEQIFKTYLP